VLDRQVGEALERARSGEVRRQLGERVDRARRHLGLELRDEPLDRRLCPRELREELLVLRLVVPPHAFLERRLEDVLRQRLLEEAEDLAAVGRLARDVQVRVGRHQDPRRARRLVAHALQELHPVPTRHLLVAHDDRKRPVLLEDRQRLSRRLGDGHVVRVAHETREALQHRPAVVDEEHLPVQGVPALSDGGPVSRCGSIGWAPSRRRKGTLRRPRRGA
jgi:hypothetical protein